jgi:glutathione synthase/RimK-type ligase-like ATP-grasp enzyme
MFATQYAPHDLPRDVERRCVALVGRLGLTYGAIDMIVTPDGRYVFLEINPSGLYQWIEVATGLPITDAICDLLIAASRPAGQPVSGLAA